MTSEQISGCECAAHTIRTDYGTGIEYDVDTSSCPIHGSEQVRRHTKENAMHKAIHPLPYVETKDGQKWSAKAIEDLQYAHDGLRDERDRLRLELALLKGKLHLLALGRDA